ncbi:arylesterase [Aromatoleum evansii]|uniref:Arylesterase n=1 Tax=Aromatoleum evansii TaxID=59406 RepID=A0ABZ1APZ7_AROEV|nr:arylesterase [Aromatoleum evansii]
MPLRSIVTFLFALLLSGAAQAATILVWGDSLSAGYGLRSQEDWPTLLQTRLVREGFRHTVINGSVSGETTAGGRTRLSAALDRHKPDLVILELGANDGLRGLQPALMGENLSAMIQAARGKGAKVLLVGMQLPPNYGPAYTRRFQQTFTEVARSEKVPLVPFLLDGFADKPDLFQPDGIHPTAEAQPLILETVWKGLKGLLKG